MRGFVCTSQVSLLLRSWPGCIHAGVYTVNVTSTLLSGERSVSRYASEILFYDLEK